METTTPRRPLAMSGRALAICLLLLALYYVLPVEPGNEGTRLWVRVSVTAVAGLLVTWLIVREVRRQLTAPPREPLAGLLVALVAGVVFFALADYVTAVTDPGQFVGLETKTDGLYFALTTLATVGYGDVHAAGQVARGVVAIQLVFNLVIVATGASVLTRQLAERVRGRRHPDPAAG